MLNVHIVNSLQYGWAYCVTALHSVYSTLYRNKWHGLKQYKLQNSVAVNMNMHRALLTMCMCCFSTFWFAFGISVLCFKLEFSTKCATHTHLLLSISMDIAIRLCYHHTLLLYKIFPSKQAIFRMFIWNGDSNHRFLHLRTWQDHIDCGSKRIVYFR